MFKWIALIATIFTWPLISFGAFVRLNAAGLSCPDWPLCYGKLIPPKGYAIGLEVGHRFVATLLGLLIIGLVILAYRNKQYFHFRKIAWWCLGLVVLQGFLGGLTVILKLNTLMVTSHLLGGNALFALLIYCTYFAFKADFKKKKSIYHFPNFKLSRKTGMMLFLFLGMIVSGGANSSTYSGYVCEAFPGCHSGSVASFSRNVTGEFGFKNFYPSNKATFFPQNFYESIHMLHRGIVVLGSCYLIFLVFSVWFSTSKEHALKQSKFSSQYYVEGSLLIIFIFLEIGVGVLNALYRVPVPISALHTTLASTIVGILSFSFAKANYDCQ
ncbi:MAG: cytochrome c oxidase assembly protein subunit 15 [bacterium]|jgi:cytochrome c oxidase assembly protein subunit 15